MVLRSIFLSAICLAIVASPVFSQGKPESIRQAARIPAPVSEPSLGIHPPEDHGGFRVLSWPHVESYAKDEGSEPIVHWMAKNLSVRFWPKFAGYVDVGGSISGWAKQSAVAGVAEEYIEKERSKLPKLLPGTSRWLWRDLDRETDQTRHLSNGFYVQDQEVLGEDPNPEVWKIADWFEANDPLFLRHEIVPDAAEIGIGADFDVTPVSGTYRTPIDRPRDLLRSPALHGTVVGIRFRF